MLCILFMTIRLTELHQCQFPNQQIQARTMLRLWTRQNLRQRLWTKMWPNQQMNQHLMLNKKSPVWGIFVLLLFYFFSEKSASTVPSSFFFSVVSADAPCSACWAL